MANAVTVMQSAELKEEVGRVKNRIEDIENIVIERDYPNEIEDCDQKGYAYKLLEEEN